MNSNILRHANSQADQRVAVRKATCLIWAVALATPFTWSAAWGQVWRYSDEKGITYYTNVFQEKNDINQASLLEAEPDEYPGSNTGPNLATQMTANLPAGQYIRRPQVPATDAAMSSVSTASFQNPASALGDWPPKGFIGSPPQ